MAPDFFTAHLQEQDPTLRDIVRRGEEWVGTERPATPEELEIVERFYKLALDKLLLDINVCVTRAMEAHFRKGKAGNRPFDFRGWWTDDEGKISNAEFAKVVEGTGYRPEPLVEAIRALEARVEELPRVGSAPSVAGNLGTQLGIALAAGLVLLMAEGAIDL